MTVTTWFCPSCAEAAGTGRAYPPGPDSYCEGCRRPLEAQERIAAALAALAEQLVRRPIPDARPAPDAPTCGVEEAARLLKTTPHGIYALRKVGKLPPPVGPGRKLLWRTDDLLECRVRPASSRERRA